MGVRGALPARYRGRPLFARTARGGDKSPIPVRAALRDEWSGVGTARCGRCPPCRSSPRPGSLLRPVAPAPRAAPVRRGAEGEGRGRRGVSDTERCRGRGAGPGGSRRVWGCLEGRAELEGSWEQGKGRAGRGGLGGSSGRVPSCPLITSPSHLPLFPPHVPSPPLVFPH